MNNLESETSREWETKNQKLKPANQELKSANQKLKSHESETKKPRESETKIQESDTKPRESETENQILFNIVNQTPRSAGLKPNKPTNLKPRITNQKP